MTLLILLFVVVANIDDIVRIIRRKLSKKMNKRLTKVFNNNNVNSNSYTYNRRANFKL